MRRLTLTALAVALAVAAPAQAGTAPPHLSKRDAHAIAQAELLRMVVAYLAQGTGQVGRVSLERPRFCARWARHVVACDYTVGIADGSVPPPPTGGSPGSHYDPSPPCSGKLRVRLSRTGRASVTSVGRPCPPPAAPQPAVTIDDSG